MLKSRHAGQPSAGQTREVLKRLADRAEIQDNLARYVRAVDRGDWELLRSTYHDDAYDDHGEFKGSIDELVPWLDGRFRGVDNSTHFLGNCLIEFAGNDLAVVETSYTSRRLRAPTAEEQKSLEPGDMILRQSWGRYVDRFERRRDEWRVASRLVLIDNRFTSVAKGGARGSGPSWGTRDRSDPLYRMRGEILGRAAE